MESQRHMGKLKRLFKQFENATQLDVCKAELENALDVFQVGLWTWILTEILKEA